MKREFHGIRHAMAPSPRKYVKVAPWDPSLAPAPARARAVDATTRGPAPVNLVKLLAIVASIAVGALWVLR